MVTGRPTRTTSMRSDKASSTDGRYGDLGTGTSGASATSSRAFPWRNGLHPDDPTALAGQDRVDLGVAVQANGLPTMLVGVGGVHAAISLIHRIAPRGMNTPLLA